MGISDCLSSYQSVHCGFCGEAGQAEGCLSLDSKIHVPSYLDAVGRDPCSRFVVFPELFMSMLRDIVKA